VSGNPQEVAMNQTMLIVHCGVTDETLLLYNNELETDYRAYRKIRPVVGEFEEWKRSLTFFQIYDFLMYPTDPAFCMRRMRHISCQDVLDTWNMLHGTKYSFEAANDISDALKQQEAW
jgi:hypothetical protein